MKLSRRQTLTALTATVGASALPKVTQATSAAKVAEPFKICLNLSTIRGHKLGLIGELETASKAGFRSVEIWMDTYQEYLKTHTTADLRKRLSDLGLTVENTIGFAPWIVNDDAARQKGVEQLKREMELLAEIGCKRTAAPAIGMQMPDAPAVDLYRAAERYRTILELGDKTGVVPQLELWGFSKNLNKLSEVMFVAIESKHPSARVLLDIYHIYKGGTAQASLPLVGKPAIEVFHVNDYPTTLDRATITDADRVYPGDGVAPIRETLQLLKDPTKSIVLSLEVFNKSYYAQPADVVARNSFAKMQAMVKGV